MAHALIIGGSLGGLFAGLLLRQAGWGVTVFERSSGDLASRGVGIGTHAELFAVMRRLGIAVDESIGVPTAARICLNRSGAVIARLPFDKILSSWALFYRALRRQLPDACYCAGMQLDDIVQHEGGVSARFAVISYLQPGLPGRRRAGPRQAVGGRAPTRKGGIMAWPFRHR